MARDRGDAIPFNQQRDDGPKAYRAEHEPIDSRPLLCWRPFWRDAEEREAYERAVAEVRPWKRWVGMKPRPVPDETELQRKARERAEESAAYMGMAPLLGEVVSLAEGLQLARRPKAMPHAPGRQQWEDRRWDLKREAMGAEAKRVSGGLRMDVDEVSE